MMDRAKAAIGRIASTAALSDAVRQITDRNDTGQHGVPANLVSVLKAASRQGPITESGTAASASPPR